MRGKKLFRIFGIDIEVHWTWFIIFGLVVWLFFGNYLPAEVPGQSLILYLGFGVMTTLLFFFSVLFHELSHSLTARIFNIIIERITLFIFGGAAHLKEGAKSAKAEFFMAAAGPVSSLVLAGTFWGTSIIGANILPPLALASLFLLAFINAMLAVFNLFPGFPLDGGRIFRAILWGIWQDELKATKIASYGGKVFGIILIAGGFYIFITSNNLFSLIWLGFIGWFLFQAAGASYKQLAIFKIISQYKVKDIMMIGSWFQPENLNPEVICHPEEDLKTVYERMIETQKKMFFVEENDKIIGAVSIAGIIKYAEEKMK